jgi:hypothetical protein
MKLKANTNLRYFNVEIETFQGMSTILVFEISFCSFNEWPGLTLGFQ